MILFNVLTFYFSFLQGATSISTSSALGKMTNESIIMHKSREVLPKDEIMSSKRSPLLTRPSSPEGDLSHHRDPWMSNPIKARRNNHVRRSNSNPLSRMSLLVCMFVSISCGGDVFSGPSGSVASAAWIAIDCPLQCSCRADTRYVTCDRGNLRDLGALLRGIPEDAETIEISAPPTRPNHLQVWRLLIRQIWMEPSTRAVHIADFCIAQCIGRCRTSIAYTSAMHISHRCIAGSQISLYH